MGNSTLIKNYWKFTSCKFIFHWMFLRPQLVRREWNWGAVRRGWGDTTAFTLCQARTVEMAHLPPRHTNNPQAHTKWWFFSTHEGFCCLQRKRIPICLVHASGWPRQSGWGWQPNTGLPGGSVEHHHRLLLGSALEPGVEPGFPNVGCVHLNWASQTLAPVPPKAFHYCKELCKYKSSTTERSESEWYHSFIFLGWRGIWKVPQSK